MRERDMVNDVLSTLNSSLTKYADYIAQSSNQQLRQTLTQIRNSCEQSQYQLYQIAEQKGYYHAAPPASSSDIQRVRSDVSTGQPGTTGGMTGGNNNNPNVRR